MSGWLKAAAAAALATACGGLLWAYTIALRAPAVGTFHDDGIYAVTAKALATGRGYRIVSLPSQMPQTKYPFLFPALLAVVWRMFPRFPQNLIWLKLVPLGCALAWVALSYRLGVVSGDGAAFRDPVRRAHDRSAGAFQPPGARRARLGDSGSRGPTGGRGFFDPHGRDCGHRRRGHGFTGEPPPPSSPCDGADLRGRLRALDWLAAPAKFRHVLR
jgi:hypothetical protein